MKLCELSEPSVVHEPRAQGVSVHEVQFLVAIAIRKSAVLLSHAWVLKLLYHEATVGVGKVHVDVAQVQITITDQVVTGVIAGACGVCALFTETLVVVTSNGVTLSTHLKA